MAQNNPELIIADIMREYPDVNECFIRQILMNRGVNKWFAVRRDIIRLKIVWRKEIKRLLRELYELRQMQKFLNADDISIQIYGTRQRLKVVQEKYNQVRSLCYSSRLVLWNTRGIYARDRSPKLDKQHKKILKLTEKVG